MDCIGSKWRKTDETHLSVPVCCTCFTASINLYSHYPGCILVYTLFVTYSFALALNSMCITSLNAISSSNGYSLRSFLWPHLFSSLFLSFSLYILSLPIPPFCTPLILTNIIPVVYGWFSHWLGSKFKEKKYETAWNSHFIHTQGNHGCEYIHYFITFKRKKSYLKTPSLVLCTGL